MEELETEYIFKHKSGKILGGNYKVFHLRATTHLDWMCCFKTHFKAQHTQIVSKQYSRALIIWERSWTVWTEMISACLQCGWEQASPVMNKRKKKINLNMFQH